LRAAFLWSQRPHSSTPAGVPSFACADCGNDFVVSEEVLAKYPGWVPKRCLKCKKRSVVSDATKVVKKPARRGPRAASAGSREQNLTGAQVLDRYTSGPKDGVFTDGAADPNPGPGGWGAVYVVGDQIIAERWGHEPHTTNNRMELAALIAGCALVPVGTKAVLYTDSELCVKTINEWAKAWQARGWKRKSGPIKNLELVQELYGIFSRRPELELRWIAAHAGHRWNEYADSLATSYRRAQR
jgi:ribonuclease HI